MDFVEQVKSSVDIVRVIGEYVRLKKNGVRYVGLCPFHTEKTPSFSVHSTHQFYKCFGCGAGGDMFRFIMEIEGVGFFEALKMVAERNGIAMPRRTEYSDADSKLRAALLDMHEIAARLFQQNLLGADGASARDYLARRGVSRDAAVEFGLGLADVNWTQLARKLGEACFTAEQMEQSGLVSKRQEGGGYYDRFRGRLMFPIQNESGKVIAFGGRALNDGDEPKYLNSAETPLYRKSHTLYNLHRARTAIRKSGHAVLVEGYMDVIGVYSAGVEEVVASCGTALTSTQVRSIKRHGDRIVVNFDPDTAGANAAARSIEMLLDEGMHVRVLELEGGLDPDEYIKQSGADVYRARLDSAQSYYYWLADRTRRHFDVRTAEGRVEAWKAMLPVIERVHDRIERATIAKEMASHLGIDEALVLERFRKSAVPPRTVQARAAVVPDIERLLINALLASEEACAQVLPALRDLPPVAEFRTRKIVETMLALWDAGTRPSFGEVSARLGDSGRELLSTLVFADELNETLRAEETAVQCLRTLQARSRMSGIAELKARIKSAERDGNLAEALRLSQELVAIDRRQEGSR